MRWMWIDRFTEFVSGQLAVAVKHTTVSEPPCDGYTPGFPTYPHSLIVEGMAQTAGLLIGEAKQFQTRVVLAKVGKALFHEVVPTGRQLVFRARIEDIQSDGAIASGTVEMEGRPQAELELVFAHLDDRFPAQLFEPQELLVMLRLFGLYDVGKDADGAPLQPPAFMRDAERKAYGV